MAIVCPTVTAGNVHTYRQQMERIAGFAKRIHIDLMDGEFAPHTSVGIEHVWWPVGTEANLHIMHKNPIEKIDNLLTLKPHLVIVHAEASGNFFELSNQLKGAGIKVGLALLADTPVANIEPVIAELDHVLIFSGDLGSFGGHADLSLLEKVNQIREIRPDIEIGWDGGVNQHSIKKLADGGVDVLNVGGFIQRSDNPDEAYQQLVQDIS